MTPRCYTVAIEVAMHQLQRRWKRDEQKLESLPEGDHRRYHLPITRQRMRIAMEASGYMVHTDHGGDIVSWALSLGWTPPHVLLSRLDEAAVDWIERRHGETL